MCTTTVSLSPQDNYVGLERLRKLMFDDWKITGGSLFCDAVEVYLERQETKSEAIKRILNTPYFELLAEFTKTPNNTGRFIIDGILLYLKGLPDE